MIEICPISNCTGCGACANICPQTCISMETDKLGHLYPKIEQADCIECMLCKSVCPTNTPFKLQTPLSVWASWSENEANRLSSSSGGIASVLSEEIITKGGIVYGAVFEQPFNVAHHRISDLQELPQLKGSKYVQSDTGITFKQVKQDLNSNLEVLYIGTPCQIAGLKGFLKKEYSNLYTIDLICHGVPSIKLLKESVPDYILRKDFNQIKFRDSSSFHFSLLKENIPIYSRPISKDLFLKGFFTGLFYRHSCYECPYATVKRIGDITLGDFWGIKDKEIAESIHKGISLVLINNTKGELLFKETHHSIVKHKRSIEEAINGNKQLQHPVTKTWRSKLFNGIYPTISAKTSISICLWEIVLKNKILNIIKTIQKKK